MRSEVINVRVLGALEASVDRRPVRLGAAKPRAVLAILALHPGEIVSTERLIEGLWGEQPPADRRQAGAALRVAAAQGADRERRRQGDRHARPRLRAAARARRRRRRPLRAVAGATASRARRSRCGAGRRSTTSLTSRSRRRRSAASRSCGWRRSSSRSTPTSWPAATSRSSPSSTRSSRRSRCASTSTPSGCSRCTAAAARPTRSPPTGRPAAHWLSRWASSRGRSCGACTRRSWPRTPRSRRRPPSPSGRAPTPLRRVDAAVGRAANERAGLRAAEDEVADGVEELQAARTASARSVACPFKGLASFDVDDARVLLRPRAARRRARRAAGRRRRCWAIVGPSGSGKSSALRAGLLPALAARRAARQRALGDRAAAARGAPAARARAGARRAAGTGRAGGGGRPVRGAVHGLPRRARARGLRRRARGRARGDPRRRRSCSSRCAPTSTAAAPRYPELVAPAGRQPGARSARCAATSCAARSSCPARRAGLRVEPELVDALVADVEGEPGALPLLSTALLELWQRRDGHRLRLSAYERAGGVRGAVARLAERAYERLDAQQREVARRDPAAAGRRGRGRRRRAPPGAAGRARGRRRRRSRWPCSPTAGCVTIGEGEVEVAHEALLREWPRLRDWLEEDADGTPAARAPDRRRPRLGARPAATRASSTAAPGWPPRSNGPRAHGGELNAARARVRGRRAALGRSARPSASAVRTAACGRCSAASPSCSRCAVVAGAIAVSQRGQAREAAVAADAQRVGAEALTDEQLDQALLLARAGVALRRLRRDARQPALGAACATRR